MESKYIVSARKYRPQTFDSVVGQKSITTTLKNAIKNNQLAQAYLFCGPRGVGKTTCARIFAKSINCQNLTPDIEPCNECESCKAFNAGRSLNIHELDAASNNSVEDIRNLIDQVRIPPQLGKYSVYIIDEVHMLSTQAFNAFLKTLEEPPKHAIFILATTEKHKILPTILSRCQIFDFNRIQVPDIVEHLQKIAEKEGIEAEEEALNIIAQKADGALRDALSFFDQIASFANKHITYEKVIHSLNVLDYDYYFRLVEAFVKGDYKETLLIFDEILRKGFDTQNFIVGLSKHFRDLMVVKDPATVELMEFGDAIKKKYLEQSAKIDLMFLLKGLEVISQTDVEHKMSQNKRLHIELMLLKLSQISGELEKKYTKVVVKEEKQIENQADKQLKEQTKPSNTQATQTQEVVKSPSNQTKAVSDKKLETKITSTPSVTSLLNGGLKKKEEKKEEKVVEKRPVNKNVTAEQVIAEWKRYGEQYKKSRPRLYLLFSEFPIEYRDNALHLKVLNNDQKDYMHKIEHQILTFINENLQTDIRKLEIEVEKFELKSKKPYTPEEKYKYLKEQNPEIERLVKEFNLHKK